MAKYFVLVACRDLKFDDGSSAKVSMISSETGTEEPIGKTKQVEGETPVFDEVFEVVSTNPDEDLLKVTIVDEHDETRGVATFIMSDIQQHDKCLGSLEMSAGRGTIVVHAIPKNEEGSFKLRLRGNNLKNVEAHTRLSFIKSDPFFILRRQVDGEWSTVYKSETVKNDLDPEWDECELEIKDLCNADFDAPLQIQIFDQESDDKHDIIGSVETCLAKLQPAVVLTIHDNNEKPTGSICIQHAELVGCVNSKQEAKQFMQEVVAEALQARSAANDKAQQTERLKEEADKAKEAAEAAQLEAERKAAELEEAEAALAVALEAAEAAEAEIGGAI